MVVVCLSDGEGEDTEAVGESSVHLVGDVEENLAAARALIPSSVAPASTLPQKVQLTNQVKKSTGLTVPVIGSVLGEGSADGVTSAAVEFPTIKQKSSMFIDPGGVSLG